MANPIVKAAHAVTDAVAELLRVRSEADCCSRVLRTATLGQAWSDMDQFSRGLLLASMELSVAYGEKRLPIAKFALIKERDDQELVKLNWQIGDWIGASTERGREVLLFCGDADRYHVEQRLAVRPICFLNDPRDAQGKPYVWDEPNQERNRAEQQHEGEPGPSNRYNESVKHARAALDRKIQDQ